MSKSPTIKRFTEMLKLTTAFKGPNQIMFLWIATNGTYNVAA